MRRYGLTGGLPSSRLAEEAAWLAGVPYADTLGRSGQEVAQEDIPLRVGVSPHKIASDGLEGNMPSVTGDCRADRVAVPFLIFGAQADAFRRAVQDLAHENVPLGICGTGYKITGD
jgi:hypothetical protein